MRCGICLTALSIDEGSKGERAVAVLCLRDLEGLWGLHCTTLWGILELEIGFCWPSALYTDCGLHLFS